MAGEVAARNEPAERGRGAGGIAEAETHVNEACALLVRGDPAGMEQAAGELRNAIEIFAGWPGQPAGAPSPRRFELHRSVERAGRLLDAAGRWCRHRRSVLFPEETTPPSYGSDGRAVAAPVAGSMTLHG
jgi:hypothetical protein